MHALAKPAVVVAALLGALPPAAARQQESPAAVEQLRQENRLLEQLATLAAGKEFYLLLDPDRRVLQLMLRGVVLREFSVLQVEVGRPTVVFLERDLPRQWRETTWESGVIEPARPRQRREIVVPDAPKTDDAAAAEVVIPPTPEEAVPAPERYHIRYRGGLVLEIVGSADDATGWLGRLGEMAETLWPGAADRVRLRLVLPPEQAAALYRSVPDQTRFLIAADPS